MDNKEWEDYGKGMRRMKVEGGYVYESYSVNSSADHFAICFVPDVDLQRYQSHLRDAYTQGYQDGHEDCNTHQKS